MMNTSNIETGDTGAVLGNHVEVGFTAFGNRTAPGKVDTGATTSSLHATQIKVNHRTQQVTFYSDALSDNLVTLPCTGVQEVHSADHGGSDRPVVQLDITIDTTPVSGASFNLNDRSNMDTKILIGQNVLKVGNFTIDPNKDDSRAPEQAQTIKTLPTMEQVILNAVEVLVENKVTITDFIRYVRTVEANKVER